ncbi:ATP-dependent DNA helicase [Myxococcota bacterium]|nr:ATP-dependent DNA helicase [Myxococcota bacterium]MBU1381201.1 ATP-dependent DNA helicase [Myxococcota bacterium]MBU1495623.1 ATP-dependent DNA helicase [Myxococcota bacterium]
MSVFKASVRKIVEYVFRSGNIDFTSFSLFRLAEGAEGHRELQSTQEGRAEVPVKRLFQLSRGDIEVTGRIDALRLEGDVEIVEEIKTTHLQLETLDESLSHMAQLKIYACMRAMDTEEQVVKTVLTYYNLDTREKKEFYHVFTLEELLDFTISVLERYIDWLRTLRKTDDTMRESIKTLDFPFSELRRGQQELMNSVQDTILSGNVIMVQAPTGIGKTMSVLYPAIKSLLYASERVFYLTAKTPGRHSAISAAKVLMQNGMRIKTLVLSAKEKSCLHTEVDCDPAVCPWAKGHFDRINDAIAEIYLNDFMDYEDILRISRKHMVCPFEMSLELTMMVHLVICDYNYVFDPLVRLRRMFDDPTARLLCLVDEAHNLVSRSRDMHSAALSKKEVLKTRKVAKTAGRSIYSSMGRLNSRFLELKHLMDGSGKNFITIRDLPEDFIEGVYSLGASIEEWLAENRKHPDRRKISDYLFELNRFRKIADLAGKTHVFNVFYDNDDIVVKLMCLDSASYVREAISNFPAVVFFSATLTPFSFYRSVLGVENALELSLDSPFPRENQLLIINDALSTKYEDRETTMPSVASMIAEFVSSKPGNYLVFFPSYAYMRNVLSILPTLPQQVIVQKPEMTELSRQEFLDNFNSSNDCVGFAVMGGIFGEGIDLTGDKLIGAAIVGVGLPRMDEETRLIEQYYTEKQGNGFRFAYQYPGFTRVLQACGRVIRTQTDRGAVLLICKRFTQPTYRSLFPPWWSSYRVVRNTDTLRNTLKSFWEDS